MDDLKLMTVRALRDLAKTHLGTGYSRLKTKAELIAALAKKLGDNARAAPPQPTKVEATPMPDSKKPETKKPEPAKVETKKPEPARVEAKKPEPAKVEARKPEPAKVEARKPEPAKVEARKPEAAKVEARKPEAKPVAQKPAEKKPALAPARDGAAKPESETFATEADEAGVEADEGTEAEAGDKLPAAAAGDEVDAEELEAEAEIAEIEPAPKPPRVMSQAEIDLIQENLGDLPGGYRDDAVTLLARDPHTLWVYWDFAEQTARRAREGIHGGRAVLRLFDGGHLVREIDVAVESGSWYLHHVTPGRRYRAELHFVNERNEGRRIGPSSNAMLVPNEGPSPVIDDRFVAIPYDVPLNRTIEALENPHKGQPFSREAQDALLARAEEGLHVEGLREVAPGEVELYLERVRSLGASETMVEILRSRSRFGGLWTSSRPLSAWTSSKPG